MDTTILLQQSSLIGVPPTSVQRMIYIISDTTKYNSALPLTRTHTMFDTHTIYENLREGHSRITPSISIIEIEYVIQIQTQSIVWELRL